MAAKHQMQEKTHNMTRFEFWKVYTRNKLTVRTWRGRKFKFSFWVQAKLGPNCNMLIFLGP